MQYAEDFSSFSDPGKDALTTILKKRNRSYMNQFPEKDSKKEKKWSLGSLFRRKKRNDSGGSSSDDIKKKGFLSRKKRHVKDRKVKHTRSIDAFDHVVLRPEQKIFYEVPNDNTGIDTCEFDNIHDNQNLGCNTENAYKRNTKYADRLCSIDSVNKKSWIESAKARAEARRIYQEESSEEESQASGSSLRIKSEENLKLRHSPSNRRSRTARTERYLKRHVKEDNPNSSLRVPELDKYSSRSSSRSPINPTFQKTNFSNKISEPTIYRSISLVKNNQTLNVPGQVSNNNQQNFYNTRSVSYDNHINKYPIYSNTDVTYTGFDYLNKDGENRNFNYDRGRQDNQPPPIPQRDLSKLVSNYCTTNALQKKNRDQFTSKYQEIFEPIQKNYRNRRSVSEDYLPSSQRSLQLRPSSTIPGSTREEHPLNQKFNYFTFNQPRSRRPIEYKSVPVSYCDLNRPSYSHLRKENSKEQAFLSKDYRKYDTKLSSNTSSLELITKKTEDNNLLKKCPDLENALDELDAIYKSLKLGDENLLDRAEEMENISLSKQISNRTHTQGTGHFSDSSFSYEPFDSNECTNWRKEIKKNSMSNRKSDDMAYRKYNKTRAATICDPQSFAASISYLTSSPLYGSHHVDDNKSGNDSSNLPDITRDDVVYRHVKRTNDSLKIPEPQPPFGIPLRVLTPSPNRNYLQGSPILLNNDCCSQGSPDVVKDDLAFRNLRKDLTLSSKYVDNFDHKNENDMKECKKNTAVRSLSANLSGLIRKKYIEDEFVKNEIEHFSRIVEEIGKSTSNKRNERDFMSDTELPQASYHKLNMDKSRYSFLNNVLHKDQSTATSLAGIVNENPQQSIPDINNFTKESTQVIDRINKEIELLNKSMHAIDNLSLLNNDNENNEKYSEKQTSSEHAKLCKKLLDCVVNSTEVLESMNKLNNNETSSGDGLVVQNLQLTNSSRDDKNTNENNSESDHDYENFPLETKIDSSSELILNPAMDELSLIKEPLEEDTKSAHSDAVLNSCTYSPNIYIYDHFHEEANMSQNKSSPADRISRIKEERRKQLAIQFGNLNTHKLTHDELRSTKTSRLRSQLNQANSSSHNSKSTTTSNERSMDSVGLKDKSSKRKSFLNRSTDSEKISYSTSGDIPRTRKRQVNSSNKLNESMGTDNTNALNYSAKTVKVSTLNHKSNTDVKTKNYKNREPTSADKDKNINISRRMEELTAITRKTLEKVESLTHRARETRKKDVNTAETATDFQKTSVTNLKTNSILKKKIDDTNIPEPITNTPISILKRKVSGEDYKTNGCSSSPPVTFSAQLIEPSSSRSRQGILKKRRSLDESKIMRHRSCSPELLNKSNIRCSILKSQRRSSLEELNKMKSSEIPLQGILRSQSVKSDDLDNSLNSPHSILKRKSGVNSANSCENSTPHVSITTAVILAAARGAEMILNNENENVRPILKKTSFSEDRTPSEGYGEIPKPILKKKSSTDTDEIDDTLRPILKPAKLVSELQNTDLYHDKNEEKIIKSQADNIISNTKKERANFKSYTICTDISSVKKNENKFEDRNLKKPRPLSVHELVKSFEKSVEISTGAIPKKKYTNRNQERFKTQPVTFNEFKQSLNMVRDNHFLSSSDPYLSDLMNPSANISTKHINNNVPELPTVNFDNKTELNSLGFCKKDKHPISAQFDSLYNTRESVQGYQNSYDEYSEYCKHSELGYITPRRKSLQSIEIVVSSDSESSGSKEIQNILRMEQRMTTRYTQKEDTEPNINFNEKTQEKTSSSMTKSIADLRIKLQENGEAWKNRIPPNQDLSLLKGSEELSEKSLLNLKKNELDASSKVWKTRVLKADAVDFVALKQTEITLSNNVINITKNSVTPKAQRFKGNKGHDPGVKTERSKYSKPNKNDSCISRVVTSIQPDDFTYQLFFKSIENVPTNLQNSQISIGDFDAVTRDDLLVSKKNVPLHKRRLVSKNPVKALLNRNDIANEYTEIITGVVEREQKRLLVEKISKTLMPDKNLDALAGLASKEDFTSVELKKPEELTKLLPYKDLMLLHIKGRRHIQVRLVKPQVESINEGDCFILIADKKLYKYIGAHSNIIEQSKTANVAKYIKKTGDMGCKLKEVVEVSRENGTSNKNLLSFWQYLGSPNIPESVEAGHPEEDETYESNILRTNMIYEYENAELVPIKDVWGSIPKTEILTNTRILIFDFGSEMYIWSGKNADTESKHDALHLAEEMWEDGYNYNDCNISPLDVALLLGNRNEKKCILKNENRPKWALFTKLTQHRETILFREKFLDWTDDSQIIKINMNDNKQENNLQFNNENNVVKMLESNYQEPDLIVQDIHLGRGDQYFDRETRRLFEFDTLEIQAWAVLENNSIELNNNSVGQFFDCDSYIYCWKFRMTVKGRELNGNPSKHLQTGKDQSIFFSWHGKASSVKEKCAAALLTLELDKNNTPQVQVNQGSEPAAFLRLFQGNMVIHHGKRVQEHSLQPKMFIVRGELKPEIHLLEVKFGIEHLRSRTSFVIFNLKKKLVIVWHGCAASTCIRDGALRSVKHILEVRPIEFNIEDEINLVEIEEGGEDDLFFNLFGKTKSYLSLLNSTFKYDFTPRLFHFNSITGKLHVIEVVCPYRSQEHSPFPFIQSELYNANQPALYLIDNHDELWLWQGWCPVDDEIESGHIGPSNLRWQNERRTALETAINYWNEKKKNIANAFLVYAGLEPLEFKNIFPVWTEMSNAANINLKDGKTKGQKTLLFDEFLSLNKSSYSLDELMNRPLPDGVDPCHLEMYLSEKDFVELLHISREDFQKLPNWKQTKIKKEKGLF